MVTKVTDTLDTLTSTQFKEQHTLQLVGAHCPLLLYYYINDLVSVALMPG